MRTLTIKTRQQIKCYVNIRLKYKDCRDTQARFASLSEFLHTANLVVYINNAQGYGPCLELTCLGYTSLYEAENILKAQDKYVLHLEIVYWDGRFTLRDERR